LIESGADVNAKGGESVATPAMWAAQRCNYYVVNLLLQNGADPLIADAQGYNILHLATFDGNVFLLILLLHQNIPIDAPDLQGHTSLMWAAYKGYSACVDIFLRWGASVKLTDEDGFTALHWALVKGSPTCIQNLVEYGSDRFAKTSAGKTPSVVAQDMGSSGTWHRVLRESGFHTDGSVRQFPLPYSSFVRSRGFFDKFFFLCPFGVLFLVFTILSKMVIFASIPVALVCSFTFQWAAERLLLWAPFDMKHLHRTVSSIIARARSIGHLRVAQSYLAGVFAASLFWVGIRWVLNILPSKFSLKFRMCTF
jgi:palmitoyltransferase ZDHHC13/17